MHDKEKIGILTYHSVCNFGANLQAFSTVNYLRKKYYVPVVINWMPDGLAKHYRDITPRNQYAMHEYFVNKFLPITQLCENKYDIVKTLKEENINKIIIGSDAVFSFIPKLLRFNFHRFSFAKVPENLSYPNPFWGDFKDLLSDLLIVGMSVSAQNTNYKYIISPFSRIDIAKRLKSFSYLSVRDVWTYNMVKHLTKGKILPSITPDPVFGFNQNIGEDYILKKDLLQKYSLEENYVLFSLDSPLLTREWYDIFEAYLKKNGLVCYGLAKTCVNMPEYFTKRINLPIPPLDWYYLIKYSKAYVGELMHPILVALHNGVPLYSFDKYGFRENGKVNYKSSKIFHILSTYELLDNYCNIIGRKELPFPEDVVNSVLCFDKYKCKEKTMGKYEEYETMMCNILSLF